MNNQFKILTILGARPQFVKAAVVSRSIALHNDNLPTKQIQEILVHTGQHYDHNMSNVFFKEMSIPSPDYNLGICDSSHGVVTGQMLEQIESVIFKETPNVVMVYGDTNSTLAGALAAAKLQTPVVHVEAGLRSFNKQMPEEINRILTDRISDFLFCPTETAVNNLSNEGIGNSLQKLPNPPIILNVGDVMYDAVLFYRHLSKPTEALIRLIDNLKTNFYLATVHRAENTDDSLRLNNIIEAFNRVSETTPIVFPIHPRTRKVIAKQGLNMKNIRIIDPVGYFDMLRLLENCTAVFTDSGGLQKEAYFFRKPCITLRNETEWVELVENGFNKLVGAERDKIIEAEKRIDTKKNNYSIDLYGSGDTGNKIVKALYNYLI